jgi:hypothetical protein
MNLRFGWRNDTIDLAVWSKNITDEEVINQVAPANIHTVVDARVSATEGSYQAFTLPQRSVGITARYTY